MVLLSSYLPCHLSKDGVWCWIALFPVSELMEVLFYFWIFLVWGRSCSSPDLCTHCFSLESSCFHLCVVICCSCQLFADKPCPCRQTLSLQTKLTHWPAFLLPQCGFCRVCLTLLKMATLSHAEKTQFLCWLNNHASKITTRAFITSPVVYLL